MFKNSYLILVLLKHSILFFFTNFYNILNIIAKVIQKFDRRI